MPKSFRSAGVALGLGLLAVAMGACAPLPQQSEPAPGSPDTRSTDDRPLVLTTFTVLQDLAQQIAGDHLRVESITKTGAEIHGYEPTPSDLTRAEGADLILANGMGLESWFEQFMHNVDAPTVTLTDGIDPIPVTVGEYQGQPNPHAWMSPIAAETYVANTVAAFSELLPAEAASFTANADALTARLRGLSAELEDAVSSIPPGQRVLATCEGAFSYLARDAGLDEAYLWAVNQESQGTPQQAVNLIDTVRERHVRAVFCESTVSDAVAQQVVADTDAVFGGTLYVDSLSDGPPVETYLDLLHHDIRTIVTALGGDT
ncbi:metal ABC transporter substrate-binding protein [Okibacterium endophyticum]